MSLDCYLDDATDLRLLLSNNADFDRVDAARATADAILVAADGTVMAEGFSREADDHEHAEETALRKVAPDDPRLADAVLYSSLEPCSKRASRPVSCTEWILRAGIRTVVFAWREPALFVDYEGT